MGSMENIFDINQTFIDQMPGLFTILDLNSRFILANKCSKSWLGFKSTDELKGKTYGDAPCRVADKHEEFIDQDKAILKNNGYGRILGLYCYSNDDWKVILAEKFPFKNAQDEIIALGAYITDMTNTNIIDVSKFFQLVTAESSVKFKMTQSGFMIENTYLDYGLTESQSKCLFFLLRGKSAKEIAKLLGLSARTVEHYIEAIKIKMDCLTKSQLIEKAINDGFMHIIPESLIYKNNTPNISKKV